MQNIPNDDTTGPTDRVLICISLPDYFAYSHEIKTVRNNGVSVKRGSTVVGQYCASYSNVTFCRESQCIVHLSPFSVVVLFYYDIK